MEYEAKRETPEEALADLAYTGIASKLQATLTDNSRITGGMYMIQISNQSINLQNFMPS